MKTVLCLLSLISLQKRFASRTTPHTTPSEDTARAPSRMHAHVRASSIDRASSVFSSSIARRASHHQRTAMPSPRTAHRDGGTVTPRAAAPARSNDENDGESTAPSGPYPALAVFDLDACFWDEEMYTLRELVDPSKSVRSSLGRDIGEGVVAASSGGTMIRINPGALRALQGYYAGEYPGMRIAAASSADTPLAVRIGRSALDVLEIVPGVTAREVFAIGWPAGFEGNMQIGRTPPLSANKAATHFPILRRETGVAYSDMLFFDDCNWGDHCAAVATKCIDERTGLGPVTVRTPRGLRVEEWDRGLRLFAQRSFATSAGG